MDPRAEFDPLNPAKPDRAGDGEKRGECARTNDRFSETAEANVALRHLLKGRENLLETLPTVPAILQSLLEELNLPADKVDMPRVAELICRDESLAAHCLRMANSPLFGRGKPTNSIRAAIRTIGIARVRDIALSCTLMRIGDTQRGLDPVIFWEHSLGCAILSRKLARSAGFENPDKAYLAGLLHDIGYIVNFILVPREMKQALAKAANEHVFAGEVEYATLGFTHCQSGEILANKWHFAPDLVEVIRCHHNPVAAVINPALVAIVALSDRVCRSLTLGLGYVESPDPGNAWQEDWSVLTRSCPLAAEMTWEDFVKDSKSYFVEIHELVKKMFNA